MNETASAKNRAGEPPPVGVPVAALAFAQSTHGRLTLVGAFAALLALTQTAAWPGIAAVLAFTSLWPQHRRLILTVAAVGAVFVAPPVDLEALRVLSTERGAARWIAAWPVVVAATIGFGCAYVELVRRSPRSLLGRRPVLMLVALLTVLLLVDAHAPLDGALWFAVTASVMALSSYLWFFAYAAAERKLPGAPSAFRQLGYWRPFWGFSNVPLGKGAVYLERVEARDPGQLARVQLSGLRLMVWAAVLSFALEALRRGLYGPHEPFDGLLGSCLFWLPTEGLPGVADLVERHRQGNPYPLATRWAATIAAFVAAVLHMAAWGHTIIATCRMAGFHAAPNTNRLLLATSVADFFNRYYFYFKELLAAFFFFPTYLRFFKTRPKLRLFAATLMAAGAGNFLFHFYRDSGAIYRLGFWNALVAYQVYAAYALLLGVGIGISQLRLPARRGRPLAAWHRVRATAGVLVFYCLLNVLDVGPTPHTLRDYGAFYVSLAWP